MLQRRSLHAAAGRGSYAASRLSWNVAREPIREFRQRLIIRLKSSKFQRERHRPPSVWTDGESLGITGQRLRAE